MDSSNEDLLLNPNLRGEDLKSLPLTRRESLLTDAPVLAKKMLQGDVDDRSDASIIFNNVTQVMAIDLRQERALFRRGVESLVAIWNEGEFKALYPLVPPDAQQHRL